MTCSRIRSGISYAGVDSSALRSMTGLMVTLVRESPHQLLIWSSRTSRWPSSIRPVGPNTVCSPTVGGVEVGVEDDLAGRRAGRPRSLAPAVALVEEVECGLGAGEVAEGLGPADVEGLGGAEGLLLGGVLRERAVEVQGVSDVELGLEAHGAGEVDVLVVHGGVPGVD